MTTSLHLPLPDPAPDRRAPADATQPRTHSDGPTGGHPLRWERRLVRAVVAIDFVSIALPLLVAVLVGAVWLRQKPAVLAVVASLPPIWVAALNLARAHEPRFLGLGSEEFKRVLDATLRLAALLGLCALATRTGLSRGLVVVLPTATALDLIGRYALRKWLHAKRKAGRFGHRALLVGYPAAVADLRASLGRAPHAGMNVIGCCLEQPAAHGVKLVDVAGLPVLGGLGDVPAVVQREGITAVAVAATAGLYGEALRRLTWELEPTRVEIMVAPTLTDCIGPRIHIRPIAGLPLLHVEKPELAGGHRLLKASVDRTAALLSLLALAPLLLLVGCAVRLTSPGPALFRQVRVGCGGREFVLYKFRTMRADAEASLAELADLNEHRSGPLFKIRRDPRVTRVGAWLRRYSLDELPQLFNVLRGNMSLVGPRPPLPSEVAVFGQDVRRRLLVPPGLTGLWQISGRSDLPWDEAVRLDLYYVENWSLALDLMILWKTVPAVFRHSGAY